MRLLPLVFAALISIPRLPLAAADDASTRSAFLVEAEDFQFLGSWSSEPSEKASNRTYLKNVSGGQPAITSIRVPKEGTYQVWTNSRCYMSQSEARRYRVLVDGVVAAKDSGAQKFDGWLWENVGEFHLAEGQHALVLDDVGKYWGRCDALFLTRDPQVTPDNILLNDLAAYRIKPETLELPASDRIADADRPAEARALRKVATIGNPAARLTFSAGSTPAGKPLVVREWELFTEGRWQKLPLPEGEALFLLSSGSCGIHPEFFPKWDHAVGNPVTIGGKSYDVVDVNNPFRAGKSQVLTPVAARQVDPKTVEITYSAANGFQLVTRWSLVGNTPAISVSATITAPEAGEYSLGFKFFRTWAPGDVQFNLLGPVFNFQRRPATPKMITSSITPQPLALVQANVEHFSSPVTFAVVADAARLPFAWPTPTNAPYGFALQNEVGDPQPAIFSPVLGLPDSKFKAGESKTVSWNLMAYPGDWRGALETASNELFKVRDYRKNNGGSLTDAVFNMIDVLKNDEACAWNARLKGFWQIESPKTVSQPAPLPLISAALLTRDEELYRTRALPSIEFVLTRPKPHFAAEFPTVGGEINAGALALARAYIPPVALAINIPSKFFGASYWQGLDGLMGGKTEWVRSMAIDNGKLRTASTYSNLAPWSDLLAAYRLAPTPERLDAVTRSADAYLKKEIYGRKSDDLGLLPFVNSGFYPYWWDLIDLYEVTQNKKYLDAAEYCAYFTLSETAAFPMPTEGDVKVNNLKAFSNPFAMWWRNDKKYRLNWPLTAEKFPERTAPAWTVARVGLSIEQPCTYYNTGDESGFRNILISAWAPNLLRLYAYTQNPIFLTYARNSTIGRFTNYPGYYLHNYTDLIQSADYPYKGPDVTDIYYHHISAHLGFVIDYLVTEAWQRSKGEISFPWVKQQGYVWFSNRIYGDQPGKVCGQQGMSLWLDRNAVTVGSEQLNYLTARGPDTWAVILMNESDEPVTVPVVPDAARTGIVTGGGYTVIADGKPRRMAGVFNNTVTVFPKGITVLIFPARKTDPVLSQSAPELRTAPQKMELGGDWGTLNAFRIRSPFGKDSLYAVLTGHPKKGCKAELQVEGDPARNSSLDAFPYEFTVYPWPREKEAVLKVKLTDETGRESLSQPVRLAP